jgi:hypothetical protein
MLRRIATAIGVTGCLWLPAGLAAQQLGPFGVMVQTPAPVNLPLATRALLPKGARADVFTSTNIGPTGESVVVYRLKPQDFASTDDDAMLPDDWEPHLAVISDGILRLDENLHYGTLVAAAEFSLGGQEHAFALSLIRDGDGSGSLLAVMGMKQDHYTILLKAEGAQGRLVAQPNGLLQVWFASSDCHDSCTWCMKKYEVTRYWWDGKAFVQKGKLRTRKCYWPNEIIAQSIVAPAQPDKLASLAPSLETARLNACR